MKHTIELTDLEVDYLAELVEANADEIKNDIVHHDVLKKLNVKRDLMVQAENDTRYTEEMW